MEAIDAYLVRKRRELHLIAGCLAHPAPVETPRSVEEAIERKFRAGAALKAERARAAWALTETHWADAASFRAGAFELSYSYQRADLAVGGPPSCPALCRPDAPRIAWTCHTASGMAALATLFMALGRSLEGGPGAVLALPPDGYPETRQLAERYGQAAGLVLAGRDPGAPLPRILLLDSGAAGGIGSGDAALADADLLVFDTTCLEASSGRIAAVLHRAVASGLPAILVRSHTKLDSLGIEYGRLGSVTGVAPARMRQAGADLIGRLASEVPEAVRLFGAAAVPAHLPPFAAGAAWRALSRRRIACIIRNNRRAARRLSAGLRARGAVACYRHGLFVTLDPLAFWDAEEARRMAGLLAGALRAEGLPVRHAGSFGFDFVATDAFSPAGDDRHVLRMAMGDLPLPVLDAIVAASTAWWNATLAAAPAAGIRCGRQPAVTAP